jgi:preprotein translocase subunit SecG
MNINKQAPKGSLLIVLSVFLLLISLYLFGVGSSTAKYDDGSGLGNSLGQTTTFIAAIAFVISMIFAFIGYRKYKSPNQL